MVAKLSNTFRNKRGHQQNQEIGIEQLNYDQLRIIRAQNVTDLAIKKNSNNSQHFTKSKYSNKREYICKMQQQNQPEPHYEDQRDTKDQITHKMLVVNVLFNGVGGMLLIQYILKTFFPTDHISANHGDAPGKNQTLEEISQSTRFDTIFQILQLTAIYLTLNLIISTAFKPFVSQQKKQQQQYQTPLFQHPKPSIFQLDLPSIIFNQKHLLIFTLNSLCAAWKATSQSSLQRLFCLSLIQLVSHFHQDLFKAFPSSNTLQQVKNLALALAILSHLLIGLHNASLSSHL